MSVVAKAAPEKALVIASASSDGRIKPDCRRNITILHKEIEKCWLPGNDLGGWRNLLYPLPLCA
ncbi:hypothetical protein AHX96_004022 [Salmonella enterica subsp. houtenae]|nr:hypothetical protein [Salmonella enterica subsp. enterica]EBQ4003422.1 hypothetical protein [Salmonella enterica]ECM3644412.1 hypothetical protein [Salmonella enterica subsp. enterica serovar Typhimurium]EDP9265891.1 hypothetical protein [Salmonella enterica subsp. houtenae]ECK3782621.1 hypothetical protein [Salmonella enterica]